MIFVILDPHPPHTIATGLNSLSNNIPPGSPFAEAQGVLSWAEKQKSLAEPEAEAVDQL